MLGRLSGSSVLVEIQVVASGDYYTAITTRLLYQTSERKDNLRPPADTVQTS